MPNWTLHDLQNQFASAKNNGWLEFFQGAAGEYEFPTEILLAVASRETNMRNIIGDSGHGYGLMQIDDRSFPDWCHSGAWKDAQAAIKQGASVLDNKRETIRHGQGQHLSVGGQGFTGKSDLTDHELLQTAIAAYNSGLWAYYCLTVDGDPDRRTTGHDYSIDTLARASAFQDLLKS